MWFALPSHERLPHFKSNSHVSAREKISGDIEFFPEGYRYRSPERAHDYKSPKGKELSLSLSGESFTRRSRKRSQHDKCYDSVDRYADDKHNKRSDSSYGGRQKRLYHSRRSKSDAEYLTRSSDQPSKRRHKHHYGESKYHERMGRCETSDRQIGFEGRVEPDIRVSQKRHHSNSKSACEMNSAVD